jgi:Mn-dependent DtxR family transcriptional regulator
MELNSPGITAVKGRRGMKNLTPSQAKYIKAVYELSSGSDGCARIMDIADRLRVSRASASLAITKLEKEKLVRKDERRQVFLTVAGKMFAVQMSDKCTVIQEFLTDVLMMDTQKAAADACALEQHISADTLCSLCRIINNDSTERRCDEGCHIRTQD